MNKEIPISTELAIVGGGPAGLATARTAAERGLQVDLFERNKEIGRPVRTSGGSSIEHLKRLGLEDDVWHEVNKVRIDGPSTSSSFTFDRPTLCVLDVTQAYKRLAEKAVEAGAEIHLDSLVANIERTTDEITFEVRSGPKVSTPLAVDASGHVRALGANPRLKHAEKTHRMGVGVEYDMDAPEYPQDEVLIKIDNKLAPAGYAWVLPYGNGRVRAGVGIIRPDSPDNPADFLDEFVKSVPQLSGAETIETHSGIIPAEPLSKKLAGDRLLMAGDSVSQASPLVGEGIRFSIEAGHLAGETAAKAHRENRFDEAYLRENYEKPWRKRYGRRMAFAYWLNQSMSAYTDEQWDRRLRLIEGLPSDIIARSFLTDFTPSFGLAMLAASIKNPQTLRYGFKFLQKAI